MNKGEENMAPPELQYKGQRVYWRRVLAGPPHAKVEHDSPYIKVTNYCHICATPVYGTKALCLDGKGQPTTPKKFIPDDPEAGAAGTGRGVKYLCPEHNVEEEKEVEERTTTQRNNPLEKKDRTHEECADCLKLDVDPQPCNGHPEGPVACPDFEEETEKIPAFMLADTPDAIGDPLGDLQKERDDLLAKLLDEQAQRAKLQAEYDTVYAEYVAEGEKYEARIKELEGKVSKLATLNKSLIERDAAAPLRNPRQLTVMLPGVPHKKLAAMVFDEDVTDLQFRGAAHALLFSLTAQGGESC